MENDPPRVLEPSSLAQTSPVPPKPALSARLRLREKILIVAVLLAILPLLVSGLSMLSDSQDELRGVVHDRLIGILDRRIAQIQREIDLATQGLGVLRDAVDDPGIDPAARLAILSRGIDRLPDLMALRLTRGTEPAALLLRGALDERLSAAGLRAEQVLEIADWAATEGPAAARVLRPFKADAIGLWLLPISVGLRHPSKGQTDFLIGYLDVTALAAELTEPPLEAEADLWLLDRDGAPLLSDRARSGLAELSDLIESVWAGGAGGRLVTSFHNDQGEEMVGAVGTLDSSPWLLAVTLPARQAYVSVARMRSELGLWLAVGLAAAVAGAGLLAQRISEPIRQMARLTQQVGTGNFQVRFDGADRADEIGVLGQQLNQMIEGLAESHRRLDVQAHRDVLTGLPNRRFVLKRLQELIADPERRQAGIALLFIDLDRFKTVNDSLGHAVGDQLLKLVARRLVACVDESTIAARLGGDEFLIVLCGLKDREAVATVADALIYAISEPFTLMDYELHVGGTVGICLVPEDGAEVAELLDMSDMAMYLAKESGRGHFQFFNDDLKRQAVRKLSLDGRLRKALEGEELRVYYQPQIDLRSGRIVATEALLRWPDQRGGFVAKPSEIIPLAEETGLIVPIGHWVMESVCQQMLHWRSAGLTDVAVSVNVSAMQFRRHDFFERVRGILERSGVDAARLGLELTEGLLLQDTPRAITLMHQLKELGIQIMIDDFGTGYSSLAYLRRFPLDYLKVAQEFVVGIDSSSHDEVIVSSVIALAKSLGLKIIAEGVETSGQLAFLSARGCDLIQGFYFARPVAAQGIEEMLRLGTESLFPRSPLACPV
jgi:diguanylate cyclase (GGDEF)-like protein